MGLIPFQMAQIAYKWGFVTNHLQTAMILQVFTATRSPQKIWGTKRADRDEQMSSPDSNFPY